MTFALPPTRLGNPAHRLRGERVREAIVRGLAQEKTRKEIALELGVAEKTVQYHMPILRRLTGTKTDIGLVIWAIKQNLIRV